MIVNLHAYIAFLRCSRLLLRSSAQFDRDSLGFQGLEAFIALKRSWYRCSTSSQSWTRTAHRQESSKAPIRRGPRRLPGESLGGQRWGTSDGGSWKQRLVKTSLPICSKIATSDSFYRLASAGHTEIPLYLRTFCATISLCRHPKPTLRPKTPINLIEDE